MTTKTGTTDPLAEVLRIAAALAEWGTEHGTSLAQQLAAAVVVGWDTDSITNAADQLGVYAECIGLHGLNDDPDLAAELTGYEQRLYFLAGHVPTAPACFACGQTGGLLGVSGQCLNCGTGVVLPTDEDTGTHGCGEPLLCSCSTEPSPW